MGVSVGETGHVVGCELLSDRCSVTLTENKHMPYLMNIYKQTDIGKDTVQSMQ